jgi:hypothetical protein
MKCHLLALATFLAIVPALCSQEFRGAISGAVTDPAGGLIAGAKVTVTEAATQTRVETVTDSAGQYAVPFLLPGDYDIAVKMAGFKEFVRKAMQSARESTRSSTCASRWATP